MTPDLERDLERYQDRQAGQPVRSQACTDGNHATCDDDRVVGFALYCTCDCHVKAEP